MRVRNKIEEKLSVAITLQHLEVINESNNHNVPPGSESHFKVVLVSPDFLGLKLIARHRLVNKALEDTYDNKKFDLDNIINYLQKTVLDPSI